MINGLEFAILKELLKRMYTNVGKIKRLKFSKSNKSNKIRVVKEIYYFDDEYGKCLIEEFVTSFDKDLYLGKYEIFSYGICFILVSKETKDEIIKIWLE